MSGLVTVLVVGGGGREHALAWRLLQSEEVGQVLVAPGNGGTEHEPGMKNVDIAINDLVGLAKLARTQQVALTVIGPEIPLAAGITDYFQENGLRCCGPTKQSAQLESSKIFAKEFMQRHGINTARYAIFSDLQQATNYINDHPGPLVIKADGLAAGKGVVVAPDTTTAIQAATKLFSQNQHSPILIEQCLVGEEVSFIVIADGEHYAAFASSQDHKRAFDNDRGPNTGGMGACSPAPIMTPKLQRQIAKEVIETTLQGMAAEGAPYKGFLYTGLMITPSGDIKVLEFNCRFGDPEAQPVLMRLRSDLYQLCQQAVNGQLETTDLLFDERPALGVVMASGGYPGDYQTGHLISGLEGADQTNCKIFHAGTKAVNQNILTTGGRVLCVTALGETIDHAQSKAYAACGQIHWKQAFYRRDIGHKAVAKT